MNGSQVFLSRSLTQSCGQITATAPRQKGAHERFPDHITRVRNGNYGNSHQNGGPFHQNGEPANAHTAIDRERTGNTRRSPCGAGPRGRQVPADPPRRNAGSLQIELSRPSHRGLHCIQSPLGTAPGRRRIIYLSRLISIIYHYFLDHPPGTFVAPLRNAPAHAAARCPWTRCPWTRCPRTRRAKTPGASDRIV